MQIFQVRAVVV